MKWGIFVTVVSGAFSAAGVYFYSHGEFARANYWLITVLIVETVYLRVTAK